MASRPLPVPERVTAWFNGVFAVQDSRDPDAGEKFASFYTADAEVYSLVSVARGTKEIAKTRENAWVNVKNKSHVLKKVYTSNEDFSSVLVLGTAKFEFTNGNTVEDDFAAEVEFEQVAEGERLKAKLWKPHADATPYYKAMPPPPK